MGVTSVITFPATNVELTSATLDGQWTTDIYHWFTPCFWYHVEGGGWETTPQVGNVYNPGTYPIIKDVINLQPHKLYTFMAAVKNYWGVWFFGAQLQFYTEHEVETYHFRAYAVDKDYNLIYGEDMTFELP